MLVTGQRVQTLKALNLDNMHISKNQVSFMITEKLKHFRPGNNSMTVVLSKYRQDPRICVLNYLYQYLKRTEQKRSSSQLFVSLQKPHDKVTTDTISRWIKYTLSKSGVDTNVYHAHSVRSASSSAAVRSGVSLDEIMNKCGWSNSQTFARWYNKPIINVNSFATGVLNT